MLPSFLASAVVPWKFSETWLAAFLRTGYWSVKVHCETSDRHQGGRGLLDGIHFDRWKSIGIRFFGVDEGGLNGRTCKIAGCEMWDVGCGM